MPYCEECGYEMKQADRFCESCGHGVQSATVSPPTLPAQAAPTTGWNRKLLLTGAAVVLLAGGYWAFVATQGTPQTTALSQPTSQLTAQQQATIPKLPLENYSGGFFTMQKPAGWQIVTAGQGSTLGIWSRDPQNPARQTFCFGSVGPFYLSQQQKAIDQQYMARGGYPVKWADMPVVSPPTASNFLMNWNALTNTRIAKGYMAQLPVFPGLTIISVQTVPNPYGGGTTEMVRAIFKQNGQAVEGLFTTTVIETVPFANGPGGHQAYAVMFMGVTAPQREFMYVKDTLLQSLASFNLSEQYVKSYIESSQEAFKGVMRAGQTLREASDIITKGWAERQKTYDILSAKRSDAMLSKERLKDPRTGDVYEVPINWYEQYDPNRSDYSNPRLQRLADNDHAAWTAPTLSAPGRR
mgnify:CR=1 FL=1